MTYNIKQKNLNLEFIFEDTLNSAGLSRNSYFTVLYQARNDLKTINKVLSLEKHKNIGLVYTSYLTPSNIHLKIIANRLRYKPEQVLILDIRDYCSNSLTQLCNYFYFVDKWPVGSHVPLKSVVEHIRANPSHN